MPFFGFFFKYNTFIILVISFLIYGCETVTYTNEENASVSKKNQLSKIKISTNNAKIKIGILLPLSGEYAQIGNSLLKAGKLSLNKTQNKNIKLFVKDTESNNENIITSYYDLINEDVDIILGPLFSKNIKIINPISEDENIIMVTFSNNLEIKNENTFISGLSPENEIKEVMNYAILKGSKNFGLILPDNKYGKRTKQLIQDFVLQMDGKVTQYVFYDPINPDFYEASKIIANYDYRKIELEKKLNELKNIGTLTAEKEYKKLNKQDTLGELDFDSLYIGAENVKHISMLASILPYYDVDPKKVLYIGNSLWKKNVLLKEPALEKGIFPYFPEEKFSNFETEYIETFGKKPHQIAYIAFDLIGLISNLQENNKKISISNLTTSDGFIGTNGLFRFKLDGNIERSLSIFKIRNQNPVEVKKANLNF